MEKIRIRGLLFDKDGVLFDFQASWGAWAFQMIQDLCGDDPDAMATLADAIHYDLETQRFLPTSVVIAGTAREASEAFASGLPGRSFTEIHTHLVAGAERADMQPSTDLPAVFARLKAAGFALGLATNDTEAAARAHLTGAGVIDFFDFIAGSDTGFGAKPEPGMCLAFSEATGLAPELCVMIGDSAHDLHAGAAAGFAGIGVLTGVATREDLAPLAVSVLPSIADLPEWLAIH